MPEITRNVCVDNVWYGPDYPDAGEPPADKVDSEFLARQPGEQLEDGDFVGLKAVTEPDEAAQFSGGQPVTPDDADQAEPERAGPEDRGVEVLAEPSQAVTTDEQAAAFRGEPTTVDGKGDDKPSESNTRTPRAASRKK